MAPRRRGGWPEDLVASAQRLLNSDTPPPSAGWIAEHLEELYRESGVATPTDRTIRNWIKDGRITVEPGDGPWSMETPGVTPEDAGLVLEVVGVLVDAQASLRLQFPEAAKVAEERKRLHLPTVREGRYIARIRRSFPRLKKPEQLYLTYLLAAAAAAGRTDQVEQFLAMTPWCDDGVRLRRAIRAKVLGYDVAHNFGYEKPHEEEAGS